MNQLLDLREKNLVMQINNAAVLCVTHEFHSFQLSPQLNSYKRELKHWSNGIHSLMETDTTVLCLVRVETVLINGHAYSFT